MFEFKWEWEFEVKVNELKVLNNSGVIHIEIFDEFNSNPDPENYQINTVNFLLKDENQINILTSLLEYSKAIIYPNYKTFMLESEYPECYPSLDSTDDLSNLYTIDRVIIKRIGHEDHAYYIFVCSSCLDYEHGITITLHKDRIIDHGEDWDDKKVCEHKGIDYTTYHEKIVKDYNHKELILTEPNPKYGKLKPWQKSQNDYYPYGLFHAKKNAELTNFIDSKKANKGVVPSLLKLSIANNRKELILFSRKVISFSLPSIYGSIENKGLRVNGENIG